MHYLDLNPHRSGAYASVHTENPALRGYTAAGAAAAAHSDIASGTSSDIEAIDGWLAAPFHLASIVNPSLTAVGFARDARTGEAMLETGGPGDTGGPAQSGDVVAPGPGFSTNLTRFNGENPDPTETCRHLANSTTAYGGGPIYGAPNRRQSGLPIIARLFNPRDVSNVTMSATLTGPNGTVSGSDRDAAHGLCLVDARDYYSTDSVYGPSGASWMSSGLVILIPQTPLVHGTYTVDLKVSGRPDLTWKFSSNPKPRDPRLEYGWGCSFTNPAFASGRLVGDVANPPDTGKPESYDVSINGIKHLDAHVADGTSRNFPTFSNLRVGTYKVVAAGVDDGTAATSQVSIPACPAYAGVGPGRVGYNPQAAIATIGLDNRRNLGAVTIVITRTHLRSITVRVPGKSVKTVNVGLNRHGTTVVTANVGGHARFSLTFRL